MKALISQYEEGVTTFLSSLAGKHEAYSHIVKNHQLTYPNQNIINYFLLFLNVNRHFSKICMRYNSNLPKVYSIWVVVGVQAIYIKAENLSMPLSEEPVVLKIINHFPKRPIHVPLS